MRTAPSDPSVPALHGALHSFTEAAVNPARDGRRCGHMLNLHRPWRSSSAAAAGAALLAGCVVAPVGPAHYPRPAYRTPPPPAATAPLYFYPELNQSEARQDRDRYECYRWAVRETGSDPGMTGLRGTPGVAGYGPSAPPPPQGADVAAGAATGAVIGAIASSPRHAAGGAVLGAIFGAAVGAATNEARQRYYDDAQARDAEAAARSRAPLDDFRRAMSACMSGRGYNVR